MEVPGLGLGISYFYSKPLLEPNSYSCRQFRNVLTQIFDDTYKRCCAASLPKEISVRD
jgi:hypothetical protein